MVSDVKFYLQVNPDMVSKLENAGLSFVGKDETGNRMEVHPQLHLVIFPPLFCGLYFKVVSAAIGFYSC